jgi:hypothetical protein
MVVKPVTLAIWRLGRPWLSPAQCKYSKIQTQPMAGWVAHLPRTYVRKHKYEDMVQATPAYSNCLS